MRKEKRKVRYSSSPHIGQNSSPAVRASSPEYPLDRNEKKRKLLPEDDSILFVSAAEDRIIRGSLPKRQKIWHSSPSQLPMTTEWVVSQKKVEMDEDFESDSSDDDSNDDSRCSSKDASSDYFKGSESSIIINDSYRRNYDESGILAGDNFNEVLEAADDIYESELGNDLFSEKQRNELSNINTRKKSLNYRDHSMKIYPLPAKNAMIVLLNHPASITLYQYVSVSVLSGTVSIYGSEINSNRAPVKVFSSEMTGLIEVKTEKFENIWADKDSYKKLDNELTDFTGTTKQAHKILRRYKDTSVLIVVERCTFPPPLQFLKLYYPDVLQFKLETRRGHYYVSGDEDSIKFDSHVTSLANHIISAIRGAKLREADGPRILVYGRQNTGKSSLLRFLINRVLHTFPVVYYLDTDPGQTEFTPPGVVSLTKVNKPIIDPPFCHQKKPVSMIFTGSVTPSTSPDMYNKSIAKLEHLIKRHLSDEVLFVNTMGWMEGLGLEFLKNTLKVVKPTILIEITKDDDTSMFDYREFLSPKTNFFQIQRQFPHKKSNYQRVKPQDLRNLSLLSYFGKCQLPYDQPRYLNEFKPFLVNWDKIPIYVFGTKIPPYKLVEAVNASIVALCRVDESLILESEVLKFQKTLEDDPENECIGYGLVRAIDTCQHILYIVTPLKAEELAHVNAIIKGKVLTPDCVILNQPCVGVKLPFTDERTEPGKEDETSETTKAYRKTVPKRHKRINKQK